MSETYLVHHGILGQKWGKRNGPPYPLDASDHSKSEQKAGWRESLKKSSKDSSTEKKRLTDDQKAKLKKAAIIGASVVGAGLVAYGGYKLASNPAARAAVQNALAKIGKSKLPEVDDIPKDLGGDLNPLKRKNNCKDVADAFIQRKLGVNPKAVAGDKSMTGNLHDWVAARYNPKGVQWLGETGGIAPDPSGDSTQRVTKQILKRFNEGDCGIIGVEFRTSVLPSGASETGHAFNWYIENGLVVFRDEQPDVTLIGDVCSSRYLTKCHPSKEIEIVKLTKDAFAK